MVKRGLVKSCLSYLACIRHPHIRTPLWINTRLLLIQHWTNTLLQYFGGHTRGVLHVDTVLISMRCISFAVTVRAFGEHLAWKYTGTSMWAIGTLSPMRCVKRRPITTRIYLRSPIRMKHSKQWTVDSGQSVEGGH